MIFIAIYEEKTLIQTGDAKGNEVIHYPITKTECIKDLDEFFNNSFELNESSVSSDKLANNSVTTDKLVNLSVTTVKLSDNAVTTSKIADSNVTTSKIADSNVTEAKIGTSAVTTNKLASSSVTTDKLNSLAVTTTKIADSNVTTSKIADSNVTTSKIADSNVTTSKIADSNVTTSKIADSNVTEAKIGTSAVTTNKLASSSVTTDKLNSLAVTTTKIADSNITTAKLADGSVTSAKLGSDVSFASVKFATIVVGTSQSGHTAKDCDYLCTGTSDQSVINTAISALPSTGGKVLLLEGTYNLTGIITLNKESSTLEGMGYSTKLVNSSSTNCIYVSSSYTTVTNLYISGGNYGISLSGFTNCNITNNFITSNTVGINVSNVFGCYHKITNNNLQSSSDYSIDTSSNGFGSNFISCNYCGNGIYSTSNKNYTDGNYTP